MAPLILPLNVYNMTHPSPYTQLLVIDESHLCNMSGGRDGVVHLRSPQLPVDAVEPLVPAAPRTSPVHRRNQDLLRRHKKRLPADLELLRHLLRAWAPITRKQMKINVQMRIFTQWNSKLYTE